MIEMTGKIDVYVTYFAPGMVHMFGRDHMLFTHTRNLNHAEELSNITTYNSG